VTQLIIDGLVMPEALYDQYSCPEVELGSFEEMISGRIVFESRGKVWQPSCSYDYLMPEDWKKLSKLFRTGRPFTVQFLPDDGDGELQTSQFVCTELNRPTFAFSVDGVAYWHNVSFTLREANPHD